MNIHRREFLKQTGFATTAIALAPGLLHSQPSKRVHDLDQIIQDLTEINDTFISDALSRQIHKPGDRWHGGFMDSYDMAHAHVLRTNITRLSSSFLSQASEYYRSDRLHESLHLALDCLLNVQHDDGTIDLHSTNFRSPPDTAFFVNYLSPAYAVLLKMDGVDELTEKLGLFLHRTEEGLLVGGIHTPNHRWVVCHALARLHQFFPSQQYIDRMDDWLGEGIDMDPDGQYQETSVATYTPHVNNAFQTIGHLLDRPELLDVVRKNLEMTLYYIRPHGELMSAAAGRGPRFGSYISRYYYGYKYFAIVDQNPVYAAVADFTERELIRDLALGSGGWMIPLLLEDPVFQREMTVPTGIPDDYVKRFPHSGVFRIRRGDKDLAAIENNTIFFTYMKGKAVLEAVQLHAAFYGSRGQFQAETADMQNTTITLERSVTHGYFQPFPEDKRTGDGDWSKLPRDEREMTQVQTLNYRVTITEQDGNVTMDVEIEGVDHVPVSLELSFRRGGELHGVVADPHNEHSYFMNQNMGRYKSGKDVIHFGPGKSGHKWARMRGMMPKHEGESVHLTGETPFKHTITFH